MLPARAACYSRMSTEHKQYPIDNQSDVIAKYAESHRMEIVRRYTDAGKCGLTLQKRVGLQQLLNDVERRIQALDVQPQQPCSVTWGIQRRTSLLGYLARFKGSLTRLLVHLNRCRADTVVLLRQRRREVPCRVTPLSKPFFLPTHEKVAPYCIWLFLLGYSPAGTPTDYAWIACVPQFGEQSKRVLEFAWGRRYLSKNGYTGGIYTCPTDYASSAMSCA